MKYERFEDLPVWRTAIDLARRVYALTRDRFFNQSGDLRDQLRRAALSISNNVAEGFERGSTNELLAFLYIARGSAGEVRSMLCFAERLLDTPPWNTSVPDLRGRTRSPRPPGPAEAAAGLHPPDPAEAAAGLQSPQPPSGRSDLPSPMQGESRTSGPEYGNSEPRPETANPRPAGSDQEPGIPNPGFEISDPRSEIPNLKSLAESCSRQIRAWADHLQNTDIKGPRHLDDRTRRQYDARNRTATFQLELARILHKAHPEIYPDPDAPPEAPGKAGWQPGQPRADQGGRAEPGHRCTRSRRCRTPPAPRGRSGARIFLRRAKHLR
ncbi:MAG: four helix bundle protein [Acidobacteria bacterium]|nr:four helix bundle protein [Acidobacteriota bacterium]